MLAWHIHNLNSFQAMHKATSVAPPQDMSFLYHPQDPKRALIVKASDLRHLKDEEWLNDTIMEFYIR